MVPFKLPFSIICFLILAIFGYTHAQNSQLEYLYAHNKARAEVCVRNMVWNATVASYALNYAMQRIEDCSLVHSDGPYGENLATGSGTFTVAEAIDLWVAEKNYYDYMTNMCASGYVCGHYTQMVWHNSVQLGCAKVQCANNNWWFVVCSYYPRGNYLGEFPY